MNTVENRNMEVPHLTFILKFLNLLHPIGMNLNCKKKKSL
jgi:hypothetical protein